mgnify:CR=1 FL=1
MMSLKKVTNFFSLKPGECANTFPIITSIPSAFKGAFSFLSQTIRKAPFSLKNYVKRFRNLDTAAVRADPDTPVVVGSPNTKTIFK